MGLDIGNNTMQKIKNDRNDIKRSLAQLKQLQMSARRLSNNLKCELEMCDAISQNLLDKLKSFPLDNIDEVMAWKNSSFRNDQSALSIANLSFNDLSTIQKTSTATPSTHRHKPKQKRTLHITKNASMSIENFTCPYCRRYLKSRRTLKAHMFVHTERFSCDICGKKLSRLASLTNHRIRCKEVNKMETIISAKTKMNGSAGSGSKELEVKPMLMYDVKPKNEKCENLTIKE